MVFMLMLTCIWFAGNSCSRIDQIRSHPTSVFGKGYFLSVATSKHLQITVLQNIHWYLPIFLTYLSSLTSTSETALLVQSIQVVILMFLLCENTVSKGFNDCNESKC